MNPSASLSELRLRIRALERAPSSGTLPFGVPGIDAHLPKGGLERGALHEIAGCEDAGIGAATLFAAGILARLGGPVLWCGGSDLYPPGLACVGLHPDRVIHAEAKKVLAVMEEGLRHPGLAAVLGELEKLPDIASRRLGLAAEKSGVLAVALRRGTSDSLNAAATRWRITSLPSATVGKPHGRVPDIGRARWEVALTRCRGGEKASWIMEACDAQGCLGLPAALAGGKAAPQIIAA